MSNRTPHSSHRTFPYPNTQPSTPGPSQHHENIFNSSFSSENSATNSNYGSNDVGSQGQSSFSNDLRGSSNINHQGLRHEQSAYLVTKIASREDLDMERRHLAHEFHMGDEGIKMTALYIHGLALDKKLDAVLQRSDDQLKKLLAVHVLVNAAWAITPAQKGLLQDLLQHYLIKATCSYKNIVHHAEAYIASHRTKYHLENYSTEDAVKKTINMFLVKALVALKSKYRKKLFKLVNAHIPLDTLSRTLVNIFHMTPRPTTISNGILAGVALQRHVAGPLAPKKNAKGADTGFWEKLNREMRGLVAKNGDDRKDARWLEWEVDIIAADRAGFSTEKAISSDEEGGDEEEDGLP